MPNNEFVLWCANMPDKQSTNFIYWCVVSLAIHFYIIMADLPILIFSLELGFPLDKAVSYAKLRNPLLINDLNMQYYIQDRY